jgi:hypothetical protein
MKVDRRHLANVYERLLVPVIAEKRLLRTIKVNSVRQTMRGGARDLAAWWVAAARVVSRRMKRHDLHRRKCLPYLHLENRVVCVCVKGPTFGTRGQARKCLDLPSRSGGH